jgi:hypothetical protein
MLHLVNGQCTLDILEKTSILGDKVSVDDILMEGPLPDYLQDEAAWRKRASWLQKRFGISETEYLQKAQQREQVLEQCSSISDVTLWYENDVFCQINFLYIFQRLAQSTPVQLHEVCPDEDRLGLVDISRLEKLFKQRVEVSSEKLILARDAWKAICGGAAKMTNFLQHDFSAWPRLRNGLELYLEYQTHPLRLQTVVTNALEEGKSTLSELLVAVNNSVAAKDYGIGDLQLARLIMDWREEILIEGKVDFDNYQQLSEHAQSWKLKQR